MLNKRPRHKGSCISCDIGMWVGHRWALWEGSRSLWEGRWSHWERSHYKNQMKSTKNLLPSREHCLSQVNLKALFCDFILFTPISEQRYIRSPIIIVGIKIIINWWLLPETSLISTAAYKLGAAGGNQVIQHL